MQFPLHSLQPLFRDSVKERISWVAIVLDNFISFSPFFFVIIISSYRFSLNNPLLSRTNKRKDWLNFMRERRKKEKRGKRIVSGKLLIAWQSLKIQIIQHWINKGKHSLTKSGTHWLIYEKMNRNIILDNVVTINCFQWSKMLPGKLV